MGILVNKGSMALKYLKVGQVLLMKYNPENPDGSPEQIETEIRHITLTDGRFRGHYLVGLRIKKQRWSLALAEDLTARSFFLSRSLALNLIRDLLRKRH